MKRTAALLLCAAACGGNPQPRSHFVIPLPPPPCVANDTIYAPLAADTLRGLFGASLTSLDVVPSGVHGSATARVLVNALGDVVKDSIHVRGASRSDSLTLVEALSHDHFTPARLGACSVRSWFDLKVSHSP